MHIVNGTKRYIGCTGMVPEKRWGNGHCYAGNPEFTADIMQYGWDNIEHIIVRRNMTKEDAYELEQTLIEYFTTADSTKVYNQMRNVTYKRSDEWLKQQSKPVLQISKTTNTVIKEWPSLNKAARELNISDGNICSAIHGTNKYKSAGGYIWRYKEKTTTTVTTTITCEQE